jgi:hypothetical protein
MHFASRSALRFPAAAVLAPILIGISLVGAIYASPNGELVDVLLRGFGITLLCEFVACLLALIRLISTPELRSLRNFSLMIAGLAYLFAATSWAVRI